MKNYDYILFDLDGTLTDSKVGIQECIKFALDTKGIQYENSVLDKMIGPPFRISMHDFLGLEMPMIEELIGLYRGEYEKYGWAHNSVYDGVRETLETLKKSGKKLAVATSKPQKFTNQIIKGFDLEKYFDFVGAASSDTSKELKCDVIASVLDALNVEDKSKVLMVGDRMYDIDGAHIVGVDVCAVLYGYGNKEEFVEHNATYIVEKPQDIIKLVENCK